MTSREADIEINGVGLSQAEAMTLRVALTSFYLEMHTDNPLGDDEHGKAMQDLYLLHTRNILKCMQ